MSPLLPNPLASSSRSKLAAISTFMEHFASSTQKEKCSRCHFSHSISPSFPTCLSRVVMWLCNVQAWCWPWLGEMSREYEGRGRQLASACPPSWPKCKAPLNVVMEHVTWSAALYSYVKRRKELSTIWLPTPDYYCQMRRGTRESIEIGGGKGWWWRLGEGEEGGVLRTCFISTTVGGWMAAMATAAAAAARPTAGEGTWIQGEGCAPMRCGVGYQVGHWETQRPLLTTKQSHSE